MTPIHQILKRYWGFDHFRSQQEEIITAVLKGKDALALLPTGGGKSLCYQIPALASEGICLVISPLIALMKDQVEGLKKKGIGALAIYSGMSQRDILRTLENARDSYFKFLYVSPERLETNLFKEYLPAFHVNLIAVDEAHCISQWGYDFRPSYLKIAELREELPDVPMLAVTASATPDVQRDICERLLMKSPAIFHQSFSRPNLSYSAFKVDSKVNKILQIARGVQGSGIVYCKSRKRTTEIASVLAMHNISAAHYHAGLPTEERNKRQQEWQENKTRVIVCTNAFGMGIDKPDVRFVVHADVPDCLENYYQEAGRCGRDGEKAYAVLLYDDRDIDELQQLHITRYPTLEEIRIVYAALVNYLQIPVHTGDGERFQFQLEQFIKNFKLNPQSTLYCLKALEQDGWLEFNERSFTPSTVVFTTSKENIYEFYRSHAEMELLATTLLRTYDGIFDFPAFISETTLAQLLKLSADEVKKQLLRLSSFHIVDYQPQNDSPQIVFRKNRVAVQDFTINMHLLEGRKKVFLSRVKTIIEYTATVQCRSNFISNYFGEEDASECGVCDNCISRRKKEMTLPHFQSIAEKITNIIKDQPATVEEVILKLQPTNRDRIWRVINFLQAEDKLTCDITGRLTCK